ncbi:MAG TPA: HAMP domain-containing protein, partial [Anaerolineae bacterium]|nr:HAMP domain-containing protein [Anaerolineae bacterium]
MMKTRENSLNMKTSPVALRRLGRLGLKLLLPLSLMTMISLLLMGMMFFSAYYWQKAGVINLQKELAAKAAIAIEDYVEGIEAKVVFSAQSLGLIEAADTGQQRLVLKRLIEQQLAISELTIIDENGQEKVKEVRRLLATSTKELTNQAQAQKFSRAMEGENYISPIYFARGEPYVTMAVPIRDANDQIVGVLTAEVSLVYVWDIVSQTGFGQTGYAYAVDQQGQLLISRRVLALQPQTDVEALAGVKAAMTGEREVKEYVGLRGKRVIGAWHPIERLGWKVIAELPTAEAYIHLRVLLTLLSVQVVVGGAVATGAWLYVSQQVVSPILEIQQGARFIGDGHLDHRLTVETGDELADLARVFNSMTAQLQDLVGGLEQRVAERTRQLERRAVQLETAADISR